MAGKTIKIMVDLPPKEFAFIGNRRIHGGETCDIDESMFDPKSKWMKRKEVPAPKSQPSKLTKKSDKSKSA